MLAIVRRDNANAKEITAQGSARNVTTDSTTIPVVQVSIMHGPYGSLKNSVSRGYFGAVRMSHHLKSMTKVAGGVKKIQNCVTYRNDN
jgi:hypothetical protein